MVMSFKKTILNEYRGHGFLVSRRASWDRRAIGRHARASVKFFRRSANPQNDERFVGRVVKFVKAALGKKNALIFLQQGKLSVKRVELCSPLKHYEIMLFLDMTVKTMIFPT